MSNHLPQLTPQAWDVFIARLISLESDAHKLGLHATAHALNDAKKKAGYEYAEHLVKED